MNSVGDYFVSCDWGTTNFRLRLVERQSLKVIAEQSTGSGIRQMHKQFLAQKHPDRISFYTNYLKTQLEAFPHKSCQVVISGMASSNLGLKELPYAEMPFDQNGEGLGFRSISVDNELDLLLISGVRSENGMMRGEETQAIGLEEYLKPVDQGMLILPGTHSKHLTFKHGKFIGLNNFMTGEIFEVMSEQSILTNSVVKGQWELNSEKAFIWGLKLGIEGRVTANLFTIRAKHVLQDTSKQDNYYMLSGMLIGDELSYLQGHREAIVLAAPDSVFKLYQTALLQLLPPEQLILISENQLSQALVLGQRKILQLYER